jgi:hypothetical protein
MIETEHLKKVCDRVLSYAKGAELLWHEGGRHRRTEEIASGIRDGSISEDLL